MSSSDSPSGFNICASAAVKSPNACPLEPGLRGFPHLTELAIQIFGKTAEPVVIAGLRTDVGSSLFFRTISRRNFSHNCNESGKGSASALGLPSMARVPATLITVDRDLTSGQSWVPPYFGILQPYYPWEGRSTTWVGVQFLDLFLRVLANSTMPLAVWME